MKKNIPVIILFLVIKAMSLDAQPAFTIFNTGNSPLPENSVAHISIDRFGKKWICTDFGLAVYNDTSWTVYLTTNSGLSDNSVKCVAFDASGNAWIGTQTGGLNKFDGVNW